MIFCPPHPVRKPHFRCFLYMFCERPVPIDNIRSSSMFLPNTDTASVKATREGLLAHKLPSESKALPMRLGSKKVGAAQEARIASRKRTLRRGALSLEVCKAGFLYPPVLKTYPLPLIKSEQVIMSGVAMSLRKSSGRCFARTFASSSFAYRLENNGCRYHFFRKSWGASFSKR